MRTATAAPSSNQADGEGRLGCLSIIGSSGESRALCGADTERLNNLNCGGQYCPPLHRKFKLTTNVCGDGGGGDPTKASRGNSADDDATGDVANPLLSPTVMHPKGSAVASPFCRRDWPKPGRCLHRK